MARRRSAAGAIERPDGPQQSDRELPIKKGETVSFEVLCRPRSGAALQEIATELAGDTVERYSPSQRSTADVAASLQRLGFRVFNDDACTSVSGEGSCELFERVFNTGLRKRERTLKNAARSYTFEFFDIKKDAPEPNASNLAGALYVTINRPPIFMQSPLPPPVPYFHLSAPGDVAMLTNASAAHRRRTPAGDRATGAGVTVAMIDTGFYVHPFIKQHGYRLKPVAAADAGGPGDVDPHGHGTGEVVNIFSCAPDAAVVGVRMGDNPVLSFDRAMAFNPKVISCSWAYHIPGATSVPLPLIPLYLRVLSVVAGGVTVVFAGGNGHIAFPSMMPQVIAVGGVYADNAAKLSASNYASSFTSQIFAGRHVPDLCGLVGLSPGAKYIMLPIPSGCVIDQSLGGAAFPAGDGTTKTDGWGVFSGTSAAAPQVAGVCALLIQKSPGLTPNAVKALLTGTATDVTVGTSGLGHTAGPGWDKATGAGLVNALDAWRAAP